MNPYDDNDPHAARAWQEGFDEAGRRLAANLPLHEHLRKPGTYLAPTVADPDHGYRVATSDEMAARLLDPVDERAAR